MIFFEKIKNEIEKKDYKVYQVNLGFEDVLRTGIQFDGFEKLEAFMYDQKLSVIFFSKYYDNPYDYVITEETFRKLRNYYDYNLIDVIADDIDKYNKKVLKIDFNEPSAVIVACIFEGKYCYVYLENDKVFNKQELVEAEEKLQEIIEKNENRISEKKTENKKIVEELKEKLRKQILNDENFLACSNKQLRKNYTRTLFKEKLGNEYRALKDLWTTEASVGVYTDAIDFVEMIWKELKQK